MVKRSNLDNDSKLEISEQRVKVEATQVETPQTVRLMSQYPAIVKYTGKSTGKAYTWNGAGSIVEVDALDAEDLLTKLMNVQPCCNSPRRPQPKFVEV